MCKCIVWVEWVGWVARFGGVGCDNVPGSCHVQVYYGGGSWETRFVTTKSGVSGEFIGGWWN